MADGFDQSPDELAAQYAAGGPVDVAGYWVEAVFDLGSWHMAYMLTDPELRLAFAQRWVWEHRHEAEIARHDRDQLALSLAPPVLPHPLQPGHASSEAVVVNAVLGAHPNWQQYSASCLELVRRHWGSFDIGQWGAGSTPRPVTPDYEVVVFKDLALPVAVAAQPETKRALLMHYDRSLGAWLVASPSQDRVELNWPPAPIYFSGSPPGS